MIERVRTTAVDPRVRGRSSEGYIIVQCQRRHTREGREKVNRLFTEVPVGIIHELLDLRKFAPEPIGGWTAFVAIDIDEFSELWGSRKDVDHLLVSLKVTNVDNGAPNGWEYGAQRRSTYFKEIRDIVVRVFVGPGASELPDYFFVEEVVACCRNPRSLD